MRVRECLCPPSLVVEWLSRELDDRGIPGTVYAHTLLSLLHYHFCHHSTTNTTSSSSFTTNGGHQYQRKSPNEDTGNNLDLAITPPSSSFLSSLELEQNLKHLVSRKCSCAPAGNDKSGTPSEPATTSLCKEGSVPQQPRPLKQSAVVLVGPVAGDFATEDELLLLEDCEDLLLGHGALHPDADLPLVPRLKTSPKKVPCKTNVITSVSSVATATSNDIQLVC